jgi:choline kinase
MDKKMRIENYTALLLAAGYDSHISDMTETPKCLLEINGRTLFERNLDIWKKLGIKKVNLVLGYKKDEIVAVAERYKDDFEFNYFLNEDYKKQGNTFSLYLGIKELKTPCLIFNADLIYEESILEEFLNNSAKDQILVAEGQLSDIKCAKTLVDYDGFARKTVDKRAVSATELEEFEFAGEAIGILKFSKGMTERLALSAQNFLSKEEKLHLNWEHLLNDFLIENNVGTHLFTKGLWIEIDTQKDYVEAQALFKR